MTIRPKRLAAVGCAAVSRICIDGVAFATTTREYSPILRVPEWDAWCKA